MNWTTKVVPTLFYKVVRPIIFITILTSFYINNLFIFLIGCILASLITFHNFYIKAIKKSLNFKLDKLSLRMSINENETLNFHLQEKNKLLLRGKLIIKIDHIIECENSELTGIKNFSLNEYSWSFKTNEYGETNILTEWTGKKRGSGKIRKLMIHALDPFFLTKIYFKYNQMIEFDILIYPEKKQIMNLEQLLPTGFGEFVNNSSYYIDNVNIMGIQDYQRSDNFKDIHWKASARMGDLQTKVYEKVGLFQWTIILNVHGQHHYFSKETERNINMLTYICKYAIERNIPYEIYVNLTQSLKAFYLPEGEGKEHFKRTNEFLARLDVNDISIPINRLCFQIDNQKRINNTILFIGDQKIASPYLLKWKRKGYGVFTIHSEEKDIASAL